MRLDWGSSLGHGISGTFRGSVIQFLVTKALRGDACGVGWSGWQRDRRAQVDAVVAAMR